MSCSTRSHQCGRVVAMADVLRSGSGAWIHFWSMQISSVSSSSLLVVVIGLGSLWLDVRWFGSRVACCALVSCLLWGELGRFLVLRSRCGARRQTPLLRVALCRCPSIPSVVRTTRVSIWKTIIVRGLRRSWLGGRLCGFFGLDIIDGSCSKPF
jgi:hypothetical protein